MAPYKWRLLTEVAPCVESDAFLQSDASCKVTPFDRSDAFYMSDASYKVTPVRK